MKETPHLPLEPLDGSSKRKSPQGSADPWESTVANQMGDQENDLVKNQWIPFASTAVVLLLMTVIVSFVGSLAIRFAEPTLVPPASPMVGASPSALILPTATSQPSPIIETPTRMPMTLRVLPNIANVRATPSTSARIIGQIKRDSIVTPLARSDDGRWLLVVSFENGITGWVASELFETISGDTNTLPTIAPIPPKSSNELSGYKRRV